MRKISDRHVLLPAAVITVILVMIVIALSGLGVYGTAGHKRPQMPIPDSDGDGVPDDTDACPAQGDEGFGVDSSGCPNTPLPADSDGDGVPDDTDACPIQGDEGFGVDSSGCPNPPAPTLELTATPTPMSTPTRMLTQSSTPTPLPPTPIRPLTQSSTPTPMSTPTRMLTQSSTPMPLPPTPTHMLTQSSTPTPLPPTPTRMLTQSSTPMPLPPTPIRPLTQSSTPTPLSTPTRSLPATSTPLPPTSGSIKPSETPAMTEVAQVPVVIYDISGAVIGAGEVRLFAPRTLQTNQSDVITLELELTERFITPTPAGPVNVTRLPRLTYTPDTSNPSPTPRNLVKADLIDMIFERMGASLTCLPSSFEGCDDDTLADSGSKNFVHIDKQLTIWTWPIKPNPEASGNQILTVELWRLEQGAIETYTIEWEYSFTIEITAQQVSATLTQSFAAPQTTAPAENGSNDPLPYIIGLLLLAATATAGYLIVRKYRANATAPAIFISYRREGGFGTARTITERLRTLGGNVFFDADRIYEGEFALVIEKAIINADFVVVILTKTTLESKWVQREIKTAMQHAKTIIPVLDINTKFDDEDFVLPDDLKDLTGYNAVELDPVYFDAAVERLATFVKLKKPNR